MANTADTTVSGDGRVIQLGYTASGADWLLATALERYAEQGIYCESIQFIPSAANDILRIRQGATDGPDLFYCKAAAATDLHMLYLSGEWPIRPVIVLTEQTFGTPANVKVIFLLKKRVK